MTADVSRRRFLKDASQAGLALAATSAVGRFAVAQGEAATRVVIDSGRQVAPISQYLFGSFLEHLGRAIYKGIYDPSSKLADCNGFRTDVMERGSRPRRSNRSLSRAATSFPAITGWMA